MQNKENHPTIIYHQSLQKSPYQVILNPDLATDLMSIVGIHRSKIPTTQINIIYKHNSTSGFVNPWDRKLALTLNTAPIIKNPHDKATDLNAIATKTLGHETRHLFDKENKKLLLYDKIIHILSIQLGAVLVEQIPHVLSTV